MDTQTLPDGDEITQAERSKLIAAAERMHMSVSSLTDWIFDATVEPTAPTPPMTAAERAVLVESSGLTEDELADAEHGSAERWQANALSQRARLFRSSLTTEDAARRLGITDSAVRQRLRKKQLWSTRIAGAHRIPTWQFLQNSVNHTPPSNFGGAHGLHALGEASWGQDALRWSGWKPERRDDARLYFVRVQVLDASGEPVGEPREVSVTPEPHWSTLPGLETIVPAIPVAVAPASVEAFMRTEQDDLLVEGAEVTPTLWLREGRDPSLVARLLEHLGTAW